MGSCSRRHLRCRCCHIGPLLSLTAACGVPGRWCPDRPGITVISERVDRARIESAYMGCKWHGAGKRRWTTISESLRSLHSLIRGFKSFEVAFVSLEARSFRFFPSELHSGDVKAHTSFATSLAFVSFLKCSSATFLRPLSECILIHVFNPLRASRGYPN